MYSGLKSGAEPDEVLATAEENQAPFIQFEEYKEWVRSSIVSLRTETVKGDNNEES
jgi:hypothetical protein